MTDDPTAVAAAKLRATIDRRRGELADTDAERTRWSGELRAEVEFLRDALAEALAGMQEMIGYVPDVFREKWDLDAYINHAIASLMVTPGGLDAIRRAGYEPATDKITKALMAAAIPYPGSDEPYVNLHDAKLIVQGVDVAPRQPAVDMMQSDE